MDVKLGSEKPGQKSPCMIDIVDLGLRRVTPFVVASAVVAVCAFGGAARAQAASTNAIADCNGNPVAHPSQVVLACGDGNSSVSQLRWMGWGESVAVATGTEQYNDCSPNCAQGRVHSRPVAIVVSGQTRCRNGETAYNQILVVGTGAGFTLPRQCGPM